MAGCRDSITATADGEQLVRVIATTGPHVYGSGMESDLEAAFGLTESAKTARFRAVAREPFPLGTSGYEGIVEFGSRRAIARVESRPGRTHGLIRGPHGGSDATFPVYVLFDGAASSTQELHGNSWCAPGVEVVAGAPRAPAALALFDYVRTESIIETVELDRADVADAAQGYRVSLDVGRIDWPGPPADRFGRSLIGRVAGKVLPFATPHGVLEADVWIDFSGRICQFAYAFPSES